MNSLIKISLFILFLTTISQANIWYEFGGTGWNATYTLGGFVGTTMFYKAYDKLNMQYPMWYAVGSMILASTVKECGDELNKMGIIAHGQEHWFWDCRGFDEMDIARCTVGAFGCALLEYVSGGKVKYVENGLAIKIQF